MKDPVKILKSEYDPGNEGETGRLAYEVETPVGILSVEEEVGGGDPQVWQFLINGKDVGPEIDTPPVDFPHASEGLRRVVRAKAEVQQRITKAVREWLNYYHDKVSAYS